VNKNSKIIVRDLGWSDLMREIDKMKNSYTKVGFPSEGAVDNRGGEDQYASMSEVATVGAVHEFGAPKRHIPERSFIRSGVDENRKRLADLQTKEAGRVMDGKSTVAISLGRIGEFMKGRIQAKITAGPFKPLAEATIAARKRPSEKPLIDTGSMRQSVQHVEVING